MIYYECIKPMVLFKAHEIESTEVISTNPAFARSPWLKIKTATGSIFYLEENHLNDMQKYPNLFPLEERRLFAPAQEDKK